MKKAIKRLAVLAAGCVLAGLLAELLVLLLLGEQVKFPRHVVGAEHGLRINLPGARYRHKSPDVDVQFRINAQGMRADVDYAYEKPPGRLRILSLGDSFTIGYEVEVEECFSSVLERELQAMGYDVEVLNAGVSGFSTAEECLYLERELIKYDPDLVLLSFYHNDIRDNVRTGLFALDEEGLLVQKKESYVPLGALANYLNTSRVFSFLSQYSNAFSFAKTQMTNVLKQRMVQSEIREQAEQQGIDYDEFRRRLDEVREEKKADDGPQTRQGALLSFRSPAASLLVQQDDPGVDGDALGEDDAYEEEEDEDEGRLVLVVQSRRLLCRILDRMYAFLRERDVPLLIHSIPHVNFHGEERSPTIHEAFPKKCFDLTREGVSAFYSRRLLAKYVGEEQLYWRRSNLHWTPFAHDVAGKGLATEIDRLGLLSK